MQDVKISRRGVYYDLTKSPYEFNTPYGDLLKFSSAKKKEIYCRDVKKEIRRIEKMLAHDRVELPQEHIDFIMRSVYRTFYNRCPR